MGRLQELGDYRSSETTGVLTTDEPSASSSYVNPLQSYCRRGNSLCRGRFRARGDSPCRQTQLTVAGAALGLKSRWVATDTVAGEICTRFPFTPVLAEAAFNLGTGTKTVGGTLLIRLRKVKAPAEPPGVLRSWDRRDLSRNWTLFRLRNGKTSD